MLERALRVPPKRYRELVSIMAERYVKIRYRGSNLGVLWSLLNPLAMTTIYALIFGHAFGHYYGNSIFDYLFAIFIGYVTINYFLASTTQALQSIVANGALMNKMRLPASVFPIATVVANSLQFFVAIVPLLVILTLALSRDPLMLLLLPIPLAALFLVTVGVSMMTSTAYVYYRDVPHLYELIGFVIFVGTPVFYPLGIVSPAVRPFIQWTPLSLAVEQLRAIVILNRLPSPASFLTLALWAVAIFLAGWAIFNHAGRKFLEHL